MVAVIGISQVVGAGAGMAANGTGLTLPIRLYSQRERTFAQSSEDLLV